MFFFRTVSVTPLLPKRIGRLGEIAKNLWFSWNREAQDLFSSIDANLWEEVNHNPVNFLVQTGSGELERIAEDEKFLVKYDRVVKKFDRYFNEEKWFEKMYPQYQDKIVAYFCAEFGFHESLPFYAGGLGVLAAEHIKSASDLGLPCVGMGLLYKHGYFIQRINRHGNQSAYYPYLNFREMPVFPVTSDDGSELVIDVEFHHKKIYAKIWKVQVGRVQVYLLDTDITKNSEEDRKLSARLYGEGSEYRIQQQILLGVGGVKALQAIGVEPVAWHLNEGHAAFSGVERIRNLVQQGISMPAAVESIRAKTLFTTHTPVPAGHDVYEHDLIDKFFGHLYGQLGMDRDTFLSFGRDRRQHGFNMTMLALRLSGYCNGVSRLHKEVSKKIFHPNYPHLTLDEVPVYSVTNGIHLKTWISRELAELFLTYVDTGWEEKITEEGMWKKVHSIPDEEFWNVHMSNKEKAVHYIRKKIHEKRMRNREEDYRITEVEDFLRPDVLTIGYARRFTTYKRATLVFRDKNKLSQFVNSQERPVQFLFAGKAHPHDREGQGMIKEIYELSNDPSFKGKIVFIENYDMDTARHMVQGVDVWLNTPRWPMEASGTSGMKASANGVLHCSVPDGWWPEGFNGENGFVIGDTGSDGLDEEQQDINDAQYFYSLLEDVIIPAYYNRDENGLPREWIKWMKNAVSTVVPYFNTTRMLREYITKFYLNLVDRGIRFTKDNFELANNLKSYKQYIEENWHHVKISYVKSNGRADMQQGEHLNVSTGVKLGPIKPEDVVVEIIYGNENSDGLKNVSTVPLSTVEHEKDGFYRFEGDLALKKQGTMGYTVRVRPFNVDFAHLYELPLAVWAPHF